MKIFVEFLECLKGEKKLEKLGKFFDNLGFIKCLTRRPELRNIIVTIFIGIFIQLFISYNSKQEKILEKKYEILKSIPALSSEMYQAIYNEWHAFNDPIKQPSKEYRDKIQEIFAKFAEIKPQIKYLFKDRDKAIFNNLNTLTQTFWEAEYSISRKEQVVLATELDKELNASYPIINTILEKIYQELK